MRVMRCHHGRTWHAFLDRLLCKKNFKTAQTAPA
jgi:hypothetical protein